MNQLQTQTNLTPIEIALQIDADGKTTARKLYDFLELAKSQFARWAKTNIEDNEFYEEGIDWVGFDIMSSGNETRDYRITTEFAKHLCMLSKSEKGKVARKYFCGVEDKLKEVALNIEGLSVEMQALLMHDKKIQAVIERVVKTDSRVDKLEDTMVIDYGQQRVLANLVNTSVLDALGGKGTAAYKQMAKKVFAECNRDVKDYFNVNSRNNIPKVRFDEACSYIKIWSPCANTKFEIKYVKEF